MEMLFVITSHLLGEITKPGHKWHHLSSPPICQTGTMQCGWPCQKYEGGHVLHGHSTGRLPNDHGITNNHAFYRCGQGFQALYTMPTVQHFINCIPMCDALSNKTIYQPVTLRKVMNLIHRGSHRVCGWDIQYTISIIVTQSPLANRDNYYE